MEKHRKCDLTSILTSTGIRLMGICGGSIINGLFVNSWGQKIMEFFLDFMGCNLPENVL